ncbi:hypothetical protein K4L44_07985 [Halosquirtibacter laminarini]|uniref:Uncharacterized protein n=1 Tax=Halosquirtibacter laminarini TaxID=3374600 RepID=A0AC61NJ65_9BACT|nr:hypothetical protein K4L44_07985 [Prolixibacteraceae bacterium]
MKRVVLFGATGRVGKIFQSLTPPSTQLTLMGRKELRDIDRIEMDADAVVVCIGTTMKDAGSEEAFIAVDFDLVMKIATWAKQQNIPEFHILSSVNANPKTRGVYLRTKGHMEEEVTKIGFERLHIYRPSLYEDWKRRPIRWNELISIPLLKFVSGLTQKWTNLCPMNPHVLAQYIWDNISAPSKLHESSDIESIIRYNTITYRKKELKSLFMMLFCVIVFAMGYRQAVFMPMVSLNIAIAVVLVFTLGLIIGVILGLRKAKQEDKKALAIHFKKTKIGMRVLLWIELLAFIAGIVIAIGWSAHIGIFITVLSFILICFDTIFLMNIRRYLNYLNS